MWVPKTSLQLFIKAQSVQYLFKCTANSLSSQDLQPAPCSNYTALIPQCFQLPFLCLVTSSSPISSNPEYLFLFSMTQLTKNLMKY